MSSRNKGKIVKDVTQLVLVRVASSFLPCPALSLTRRAAPRPAARACATSSSIRVGYPFGGEDTVELTLFPVTQIPRSSTADTPACSLSPGSDSRTMSSSRSRLFTGAPPFTPQSLNSTSQPTDFRSVVPTVTSKCSTGTSATSASSTCSFPSPAPLHFTRNLTPPINRSPASSTSRRPTPSVSIHPISFSPRPRPDVLAPSPPRSSTNSSSRARCRSRARRACSAPSASRTQRRRRRTARTRSRVSGVALDRLSVGGASGGRWAGFPASDEL